MSEEINSHSRPKRRCVQNRAAPSAIHYVGYVEEDETPEMIMKKFEEMERILSGSRACCSSENKDLQALQNSDSCDLKTEQSSVQQLNLATQHLSEQNKEEGLLLEIFKRTSCFNVETVTHTHQGTQMMNIMNEDDLCGSEDPSFCSQLDSDAEYEYRGKGVVPADFWSDDEEDENGESQGVPSGGGKGMRKGLPPRPQLKGSHRGARERHMRHQMLTQYNKDTNALIRRKVHHASDQEDGETVKLIRLPPVPLPRSWGRSVEPFVPPAAVVVPSIVGGLSTACHPSGRCFSGAASSASYYGKWLLKQALAEDKVAVESLTCMERASLQPRLLQDDSVCATSNTEGADICLYGFQTTNRAPNNISVPPNGAPCSKRGALGCNDAVLQGSAGDASHGILRELHAHANYFETHDIVCGFKFDKKLVGDGFQAVMINQGWEGQNKEALLDRLKKIPLNRLCPSGFVFAWSDKRHLQLITKQMYAWGFIYVENLTWVWMHPNNSILCEHDLHAKRSHLTLLIFRKEGGRNIELKHQRNADAFFDCPRTIHGEKFEVPTEVYHTIETLLPTGKGRFLELWSRQGIRC
ncbi:hypothetical protein CEUSTIGMA_g9948.t1 [Chlamydomonas eustigma]|uniref:Methyltransferase n=1 Tax=Chlamydomonas eustigma TaxID=1157962 RepID=A0A250XHH6_9CHLO|nr:hypothetical protein CEUSTIGMA_g9948.t1 [Chlamydomonas eustigma]|eukprot:GAX82521.1 hypothetical protein CEUSTIGMA_g9948.t1 [Chlamydomonas eustigma]